MPQTSTELENEAQVQVALKLHSLLSWAWAQGCQVTKRRQMWEIPGDSPGEKGLVCAVKLLGNFFPVNKFLEAGFGGGLLRDIEGGVEVPSG